MSKLLKFRMTKEWLVLLSEVRKAGWLEMRDLEDTGRKLHKLKAIIKEIAKGVEK